MSDKQLEVLPEYAAKAGKACERVSELDGMIPINPVCTNVVRITSDLATALLARRRDRALLERTTKYLAHKPYCEFYEVADDHGQIVESAPCTCGLDELTNAIWSAVDEEVPDDKN